MINKDFRKAWTIFVPFMVLLLCKTPLLMQVLCDKGCSRLLGVSRVLGPNDIPATVFLGGGNV